MRLGLVGWPSETGLGMEIRDAMRYLPVTSVFLMNHIGKPMAEEWKKKTVGEYDLVKKMSAWVESAQIDTVLTWELPGQWEFPDVWRRHNVRWNCLVHWDWFSPKQMPAWRTARLLAPFPLAQVGLKLLYGLDSHVLQVPVDLERLPFRNRTRAERFVTVYGMGGPNDRRSIRAIVEAWRLLGKEAPPLLINAQKKPDEIEGVELPKSVKLVVGLAARASDLYMDSDVAIMPSKYEGVGLSLIEAQACGLPVITSNMEPMRSIAPEWLVEGTSGDIEIMEGHKIATSAATAQGIAERVKEIAYSDIKEASFRARKRVETLYSWNALKDTWIKALEAA